MLAIGLAFCCFYYGTILGNNLKTTPQYFLGTLMLCWIVLHSTLARKQARIAFGIWVVITTFGMLWMLGYEWAMWQNDGCFTDDFGNKRCAMPIAQLLFGFIVAALSEIFIVWKLRSFSHPTWERTWQICTLVGFIAGAIMP